MRDIVSKVGTFYEGLSQLQTVTASQASAAISAAQLGKYNGLMVYVLAGTFTSSATMAVTIQVTNDNGSGAPVANNWTNVPTTDVVSWVATSTTNFTPVRIPQAFPPTLSATEGRNQRIGYLGSALTFTANSSPGDGLVHNCDWFRVASTYGGSGNAVLEVITLLGQPRFEPSDV